MKATIVVLLLTSSLQQALSGCVTSSQYTGNVSVTISGRQCQAWSSDSPHAHPWTDDSLFPDGSVTAAANYCRDPNDNGHPWCFTTDPASVFEDCNVDLCDWCLSNPCKNSGVCKLSGSTFTCECAVGFSGASCETRTIVDCLNDERDCSTLTFYGRFAKCDDCTKSVVCRAKKQWVRPCNAVKRPYYDRYAKRCTKSNAVCPAA